MTESMIERVARAMALERTGGDDIWDHLPEKVRNGYRGEARAAMAAMREPTKRMSDAGFKKLKEVGAYPMPNKPEGGGCDLWAEDMADIWHAMIDEALKD